MSGTPEVRPVRPKVKPEGVEEENKKQVSDSTRKRSKPPPPPRVSFFHLFRYATPGDKALMFLGVLGAALVGCSQPMFMLLFGDITDAFINYSRYRSCVVFPVPTNHTAGRTIFDTVVESIDPVVIQNALAQAEPLVNAINVGCSGQSCIPWPLQKEAMVVDPGFQFAFDAQMSYEARYSSTLGNIVWSYMCAGNSTTQTDEGWVPENNVAAYIMGMTSYPFGGYWNTTFVKQERIIPSSADELVQVIIGFLYFFFVAGAVVFLGGFLSSTAWTIAGERQGARFQKEYIKALLRQDAGWFDNSKTGELSSRISSDIVVITNGITDKMSTFLENSCRFVICVAVAFTNSWQLALLLLTLMPIISGIGIVVGKVQTLMSTKNQAGYANAGAIAQEVLSAIRTVASLSIEDLVATKYNKEILVAEKASHKKVLAASTGTSIFTFVLFGSYALSFWFGSILVENKLGNGGSILTAFFTMLIGSFSLSEALSMVSSFNEARGAAYRIYEVIRRVPTIDPYDQGGSKLKNPQGKIAFEKVRFHYPTREKVRVLKDVSFSINVGQTVAFVGHSGCGKSTSLSLIQRLYDPIEGRVTFDGIDIRELNLKWLREQMAVVAQEPILFEGTIAKNIRFGKPEASDEEVMAAAKKANAYQFITALPDGFNTRVGEKGTQLSGGQKQRIAIARALLLDPCVMLLDEATSALDAASESVVQSALETAMEGRTTIVIAHRLSTVRRADRILVFDGGIVVEEGTYEELIAKHGHFKHLVDLQMGTGVGGIVVSQKATIDGVEMEVEWDSACAEIVETIQITASEKFNGGKIVTTVKGPEELTAHETEDIVKDIPASRIAKLSRPECGLFFLGMLAAVLRGAVVPVFGLIFGEVLNTYTLTGDELRREASFWSSMFVVLAVGSAIAEFAERFTFMAMAEKLTTRVRRLLFRALLRQNVGWFDSDKHSSGQLTSRLASDTTLMNGIYGERLGQIMRFVATMSVGLVLAFTASWKITLVILAVIPLVFISNLLRMKAQKKVREGKRDEENVDSIATEAVANIRTVAAFVAEETILKQLSESLEMQMTRERRAGVIGGVSYGLSSAVFYFAFSVVFWYGAILIGGGELTLESLMKVFFSILFAALSLAQAASFGTSYKKARDAANNIFAIIDRKPPIDSSKQEGHRPTTVKGAIEVEGVTFRYPTRPMVQVLAGISFNAAPGQTVALVGSSGCGKSTIVSLLQRFYAPLSGSIKVDGIDIAAWSLPYLRSQIGLVGQEPTLFATSIRENVRYGNNDATEEQIEEALRIANAAEFISKLPDALDTQTGERGFQLSGGQKQRIAIARAVVRNPPILLLDEATSALDAKSERVVQDALENAMKGRTTIVIAHRLSTIRNADCICVFNAGRIMEMGTHDELLSKGGEYSRLVNLQLSNPTE